MMTRQMTKRMPREMYHFCVICLCGMIWTQYDSCVTTQLKVVDSKLFLICFCLTLSLTTIKINSPSES